MAKLPKEYISVSQINSYINCSEKYYRQYVADNAASNKTDVSSLVLGSAVHNMIDDYFKNNGKFSNKDFFVCEVVEQIKREEIAVDYAQLPYNAFSNDFEKLSPIYHGYLATLTGEANDELTSTLKLIMTDEDFEQYFTGYEQVLKTKTAHRPSLREIYNNIKVYFSAHVNEIMEGLQVTNTELEIIHEFKRYGKEYKIKGYLDFLGYSTNSLESYIIDWKTAKKSWCVNDAQKKQDYIYSYMIWKDKGSIPVFRYVVFPYSPTTGEVKHQIFEVQYTEEALKRTERELHDVIRGITEGVFFKNEGSFLCSEKFCKFYVDCQNYKAECTVKEVTNA